MSKLDTIKNNGIKPIIEGLKNKIFINKEVEIKAKIRAETCSDCVKLQDEPIPSLRIKDKKNPKISNKMCGDCWCSIALKIRQDLNICENWHE